MGRLFEAIHQSANSAETLPQSNFAIRPAFERPTYFSFAPAIRLQLFRVVQELFLSPVQSVRMVVFTAAEEGANSALVCAYTADMLASVTSGSVCLVDANCRSGPIARLFELPTRPGLAEIISGRNIRDVVHQISGSNLWVCTPGNSLGGLDGSSSESVRSRTADFCNEFEYMLVSASPLNWELEPSAVEEFAEGAVLVLAANSTKRRNGSQAKQRLHSLGIPVLGAVLTGDSTDIPEIIAPYLD